MSDSYPEYLKKLENDSEHKNNTSLKMKVDLYNFLIKNYKGNNILELGTFKGNTALIFADICKLLGGKVYTVEKDKKYINAAKKIAEKLELEKYINFINADLYKDKWYEKIPNVEFSFIDAVHEERFISMDTNNCLMLNSKFISYHDYGLNSKKGNEKSGSEVKKFLSNNENKLKIHSKIGEEKGKWVTTRGTNDIEGVIVEKI